MMNFTKKIGVAAVATFVLASSANASIFSASASFRTIADITITEASALSFGTAITGKAGTVCALASAITPLLNATVVDTVINSTGSGCASGDATNGGYNLAGAAGSTITILLATATETDFTFAPSGQYNDQNAGANADLSTSYFPDAPLNVQLSTPAGVGLLSVGGTLNVINELTASTSYAIAYDISVIY
ncbi:MAG: hypothetical protein ACI8WB_006072 [Phenylobacterium sp.]|jgi:hypothetical protein